MSVDDVGLKICHLGAWNSMVTLTFFPGVNQSVRGMSLTANHRFYKAIGQHYGPWCKQPLRYLHGDKTVIGLGNSRAHC